MKEWRLNIGNSSNNETYKMINTIDKNEIIDEDAKFLNRYRLCVIEENKCLLHIYWLPKVHKNPRKARFMMAPPKCSLKPVYKSLTAVFKIPFDQIESYNFWTILNNQPVIKSIHNINRNTAASISFFNFSTLRTNISHKYFKANKRDFIVAGGFIVLNGQYKSKNVQLHLQR